MSMKLDQLKQLDTARGGGYRSPSHHNQQTSPRYYERSLSHLIVHHGDCRYLNYNSTETVWYPTLLMRQQKLRKINGITNSIRGETKNISLFLLPGDF